MNKLFQELFSYQGRFNRSKYWGYYIFLIVSINIIPIAVYVSIGETFAPFVVWPLTLLYGYSYYCISIKRAHDLDKSGYFVWLTLVPFANIYAFILLGFFQGIEGDNRFGRDPISTQFYAREEAE